MICNKCNDPNVGFSLNKNESAVKCYMEIDFLLSNESKTKFRVFPVEVKSSKNYTTSSLNGFKKKIGKKIGQSYIIHPKAFAKLPDGTICLPPYMVMFL